MRPLRVLALVPSLVLAGWLLAGCASAPARPTAPISTGEPRVEPQPERDGADAGETDGVDDPALDEPDEASGLAPPHMAGREITRAAVMLPFSHPNRRVRDEAQSMLGGIEMALFEKADENFLIMPLDTAGTPARTRERLEEALANGADFVLGPLFSANVQAIREQTRAAGVPLIAFSNDPAAGGSGAYLASLSVEEEVAQVVAYAGARGIDTFAFLGPRNDYGQRAERALRLGAARNGATVLTSQFYDPNNDAPVDEAQAIASQLRHEVENRPDRVALLIPEEGVKLRAVAPLIPYYGVDVRKLKILGTSRWADPSLWREPTLAGAWFAAPPREDIEAFSQAYRRVYGRAPSDLASLGYDAAGVAILLSGQDEPALSALTGRDGFRGLNGLFRFRIDGTAERSLPILEIDPAEGAVVVLPGLESWDPAIG